MSIEQCDAVADWDGEWRGEDLVPGTQVCVSHTGRGDTGAD